MNDVVNDVNNDMDSRIILRMIKKLNQIEQKEKSVQEQSWSSIQKDIDQEKKAKRERETAWILHGGKYPE